MPLDANLYSMFNDSQDVMPWAVNSVQGDGAGDYLPAASPLIIPFYLADARGDIKSDKYVNPRRWRYFSFNSDREHHSVTSFPNAESKRKPKTSKGKKSANDFWVKTILRTCLLWCTSSFIQRKQSWQWTWADKPHLLFCDWLSTHTDLSDTTFLFYLPD